jgi:hypothetical protein
MIGNASHRMREVTDLYPLSPDPAVRLNQLREDDIRRELAEELEEERQYALEVERRAAWDRVYRKAGGPRAPWYIPDVVWWIEPKSGSMAVDVRGAADYGESSTESLVARGFEPAAVTLRAGRWYGEVITLARLKYLDHQQLVTTLKADEPRNVPPDVPSPFRWGGRVPDGWIVWREELVPGREILRLVK